MVAGAAGVHAPSLAGPPLARARSRKNLIHQTTADNVFTTASAVLLCQRGGMQGKCRSRTQADGAPLEVNHRIKASLFGPQLLAVTDVRPVQVRRETARDPCRPGRPSSRCTLSEIYGCAWLQWEIVVRYGFAAVITHH